jgi:hypothetical protein
MRYVYIVALCLGIQVSFSQPTNDSCDTAEAIALSTTGSTINFNINTASINTEDGCSGSPFEYADVWYSLTMPVNGNLYIDGNISWNNFTIYDGCNGNVLACDSGELWLSNLSANTTLLLRVFRTVNLYQETGFQSFDMQAFETPSNDSCSDSINIPLGIVQESLAFSIGGSAIDSNFGCSNATQDYTDVWFDFTMPFDGNIVIDGSILWNKFELFEACSGTVIQCGEDTLFITGLSSGTNYKIRVYRALADSFRTNFLGFTIQAFEAATNDVCGLAEPITLSENPTSITFNTGGASIDTTEGCSTDVADYSDVWFQFTLNEEATIDIDGTIIWNTFQLFSTCGGPSLGCFENDGSFPSLSAGTYYLRVFRELINASNSSFTSFSISKSVSLGTDDRALQRVAIYPIPADKTLNVSSSKPISKLELYNLLGKKISETFNQNTMDVSQLNSGMYVLKINTDEQTIIKRVVVN